MLNRFLLPRFSSVFQYLKIMNIVKNIMNYEKNKKVSETKTIFYVQLKLLLWKNWVLRKRNKLRSVTEIVWPLLMMLMVVLLHEIGEKHFFPNCHMKAKAMPTAGEILFMQTFLCALNNTCDTEKDAQMSCYNLSLASNLGEALQEAFNLPLSGSKSVDLDKTQRDADEKKKLTPLRSWAKEFFAIETLIEAIKKHNQEKYDIASENSFKNTSPSYTCRNFDFSFFHELEQNSNPNFGDNNLSDIKALSRIKRKIYVTGVLNSLFFTTKVHKKVGVRSVLDELNVLDYIFCGPNVPSLKEQVNSLFESGRKKSRESEETMDPGGAKYVVDEFEWENDTTDFCNKLMEKIENTYSTRVVFRLFKPFIRGKLIYTPDAPVINRIMGRINETFSHIQIILDLVKKEGENIREMNEWNLEKIINKYRNEKMFLRDIVRTNMGKTFLKYFNDENTDDDSEENKIKKFNKILDETLQNWNSLNTDSDKSFNLTNLIPYLECIDMNRIIPVSDEDTAVKEALKWLNQERLLGLIVFMDIPSDAEKLPPSMTYKIRTGIERTPDTNQIRDRIFIQRVRRNVIYDLREITGGFAYLQNMIEGELIREYTGRKSAPGIFLKQMPYPCHIYDTFRDVITRTFPMFMVISWIYIFCTVIKRIVLEKEIHFKSTLRIFGVKSSQHWISWFVDAFVPMVLVTTILSVLLVFGGLLPESNVFVIWLFLTTFILPTITLAFMVSTFFFKASFAMAVSGMIYFLLYLPYPPIQNFEEIINPYLKIFACLISNVAFGLGCTWIANMEEIGMGGQLNKISVSPVPGNPITMSLIIQMFIINSVIYLLLTLYFDNVFAAHDFVRQPWYYCFTVSYWRGFLKERETRECDFKKPYEKDPRYFEAEPTGLRIGVEVINLTKEFGRSKKKRKVVNNLNINFYEDQITSFLGHNGAGKTTTISMMIGLIPITEGTVRIYGVDVKNNPEVAIKNIGICRQENILLDDLTVEEHFTFFARLKNCSSEDVENDVKELIGDLQLGHRAKQPVKILSGGMKRKVCVAMAFIGGSRTVFLDEPTAGIDPYSRRSIWELLLKYKKGRTIILTTHFLDEADLLGDRIAIISSGQLQCCGSSIFLKSQLGRGYYLTIENAIRSDKMGRKAKGLMEDSLLSPQAQELDNLIKRVIPGAEFLEEIGSEIVFILPSQISAENYNTLFTELDKNKEKLNFSSYGVTDTSLEEIFMKIYLEAEEKENGSKKFIDKEEIINAIAENPKTSEKINFPGGSSATHQLANLNLRGRKMLQEHFIALLIKRFLHHRRNFKIVLFELLLPTLFLAIALALAKTLPSITEMPPLVIDMSAYEPSSLFYSNEIPENPRISSYVEHLLGPYGLGTKCILTPEICTLKSIPKSSLLAKGIVEDSKICECTRNYFHCIKNISLAKPPNAVMSGGDTLYNMTGLDLTNWLITTEHEYSAHRLGGISFGYYNSLSGISGNEFLNLFMFKKFISILQKFAVNDYVAIDPDIFTLFLMSFSCNKTYGEELFESKDTADNIIIWFNNRGWIAGIAMMNGVANLVLRASLPNGTDPSKYSIRLINHPLPITKRQLEDQIELQTNVALLCSLSIIWALSFMPAMYAVYLVEERISGLKHLQIVSGVSRTVYWCTNLIWDLLAYSISTLSLIFLFFLFNLTAFVGKENIAEFIILLYSYGFVNITFTYSMSFLFSVSSSAFIFTACWNILTGATTLLTTFTLTLIYSKEDAYYLNTFFMIFPQFCFGKSLINMALDNIRRQSLRNFGVTPVKNYFTWNLTAKYILIMLFFGSLYFVITLLIEYQIFQNIMFDRLLKFLKRQNVKFNMESEGEDEDVQKERERVQSGKAKKDNDVLIVDNLTKVYSTRESPVVDHISVGIKRGECFGLLGLNGAGKTTVFKLLTGYITSTEGDAIIGGFSIRRNPRQAKLLIGYCPQINALDPYLTPEEHLSFFCRIRGVTGEKKEMEIRSNIERLGLTEHRNKTVKVLSGGNKRKVNTAIALVCGPELVLLDEPTSGMDVLSRRFLWNCIQDVVMEGRCVVLTSHSMEECQALCTHLSIMVNGRFTCFGSSQRLKNKFNEGYSVIVRLCSPDKAEDVIDYFEKFLPGSVLIHVHHLQMKFKLNPRIFIGTVFRTVSKAKEEKLIQDYSISQTTLESIFLKLATSATGTGEPKSNFTIFKNLCSFGKVLEDEES